MFQALSHRVFLGLNRLFLVKLCIDDWLRFSKHMGQVERTFIYFPEIIFCHEHIKANNKWPPFILQTVLNLFICVKSMYLIKNSMNTFSRGLVDNVPALVQVKTWRETGGKPLYKTMLGMFAVYMCHSSSMYQHDQRTCWRWHWHKNTTSGYNHCTQLQIIFSTIYS